MQSHASDDVTPFLVAQGIQPQIAYFGDSEFAIGRKARLDGFELVYRQDGDELIICDFTAIEPENDRGPVGGFIKLIHAIRRRVPSLRQVRGMFLDSLSDPATHRNRQRLAQVLLGQGARWQDIDGERWLVYSMR